ncbi:hypothetical protein VTK26DRAFT_6923 [Humicola hyalothermophila]
MPVFKKPVIGRSTTQILPNVTKVPNVMRVEHGSAKQAALEAPFLRARIAQSKDITSTRTTLPQLLSTLFPSRKSSLSPPPPFALRREFAASVADLETATSNTLATLHVYSLILTGTKCRFVSTTCAASLPGTLPFFWLESHGSDLEQLEL